jgi:glutaredoxin-related protein
MKELKDFLVLRDTLDVYAEVRGKYMVGIPLIEVRQGSKVTYYRGLPEDLTLLK